jgi:tetratricopeptide (TPR) repeat protein
VAVLKALCDRFPSDPTARHELMLAYSHLGDILGNPEYDNAGDPAGAFQAYGKMAEAAKFLYDADPADARALSDYGIALLRLGLVMPSADEAKRETFERSHELLTRAAVHNPQSSVIAAHKTWVESELAVLFLGSGDRASGIRYYQMAIATAEDYLGASPNDSSTQKGLVVAVRGLAEEEARTGARADALATLDHALRMGKAVDAAAPASSLLRAMVARAWQAAGSVYAILGSRKRGPQAAQDRETGRQWYQRALDEWRRIEPLKGFQPSYRKEMEAAMQALGALGASR